MHILLLEDDKVLSESLKEYLELDGFEVDTAFTAQEAYEKTFENSYDLYIFDINLPDEDGFKVLKNLKDAGDDTPTIYITALTDTNSIAKGFELGAEDYIKKPFDPEELSIRIKSRYQKSKPMINYKHLKYDPIKKELFADGKLIILGEVGQNIMHDLLQNIGKVVSSYDLMEYLKEPSPNALRVNIAKLKSKLNIDIKNIRGQGYMLEKV